MWKTKVWEHSVCDVSTDRIKKEYLIDCLACFLTFFLRLVANTVTRIHHSGLTMKKKEKMVCFRGRGLGFVVS